MVKRVAIIVLSILLFASVWANIVLYLNNKHEPEQNPVVRREMKRTFLGDEFLYVYKEQNFPDYEFQIYIYEKNSDSDAGMIWIEGGDSTPELKVVYNSDDVRCYLIKDCLIYKVGDSDFGFVDTDYLPYADVNSGSERINDRLLHTAKLLFNTKEWYWVELFGKLLLSTGDSDIVSTIERYAQGEFTQEELEINNNSEMTELQIQQYAIELLT